MDASDDPGPGAPHRFTHQPLLGTVVDVRVEGDADEAAAFDRAAVAEIARLQAIFSAFDPASELERWKRDELADPSPEFVELMGRAAWWHESSDGAFNPMSGVLGARWRLAAELDEVPSDDELATLADSIRELPFHVADGRVERTGDCGGLQLHAIAKGFIVDRAMEAGRRAAGSPIAAVVNAGGDLLHRGRRPIEVGIENPLRPYDNEPPITTVRLQNRGLATSGGSRRYVRIGGRRFGHVLDPRTGRPADHQASISVVAVDAMHADVIATVVGMLPPEDAVAEAVRRGAHCLVVDPAGERTSDAGWDALTVTT